MLRKLAILAAIAFPLAAAAGDRDDVLKIAMKKVVQQAATLHAAPFVVAASTAPGAERFVGEFMVQHFGTVIGEEVASDYKTENGSAHDVEFKSLPVGDLRQYERGESYDWAQLATAYPEAKAVIRLSEPAFDRLNTVGVVRADILMPQNSYTHVVTLRHDEHGWNNPLAAVGSYEQMHRPDATINPPAE